jgi:hypothetical protein
MSTWVSNIDRIVDQTATVDGSPVSASTMNPIIDALADRTQFLYEQFAGVSSKSLLRLYSQPVVAGAGVVSNMAVYYDPTDDGLKPAFITATLDNSQQNIRPGDSAYMLGITAIEPDSATEKDVYTFGLISEKYILSAVLDSDNFTSGVPVKNSGPLFLSNFEAGKLTFSPAGLMVYAGFALDLHNIFLNPSPDGLNTLYYNYRFTLLDRPAFTPKLTAGVWARDTGVTDSAVDIQKRVGWIPCDQLPSAIQSLAPSAGIGTALFYYWLPTSDSTIDADAGLTALEKAEAKVANRALGPFMPGIHASLFVNGVALPYRRSATDGGQWCLNNAGIWWYGDASGLASDGTQPWDSNLNRTIVATVNTTSDEITLTYKKGGGSYTAHGLAADDPVRFIKGLAALDDGASDTTMPNVTINSVNGSLTEYTTYYVRTVNGALITLKTEDEHAVDFTSAGTGTIYLQHTPKSWADNSINISARGWKESRPTMVLQFTKAAPDLKDIVVTSLQPEDGAVKKATGVLTFLDTTTATEATHGDLTVQFDLPFNTELQVADTAVTVPTGYSALVPYTAQAVKKLAWNNTTAKMDVEVGPAVTRIIGYGGIQALTNDITGECAISFDSAFSNLVLSVEPEGSRLEYTGLHSYLTLDYNMAPCGYVGKFLLPEVLPSVGSDAFLRLQLYGFFKTAPSSALSFKFDYAITKSTALIQSGITSVSPITYSLTGKAKDAFYLISVPEFKIPVSELAGHAFVNFRIHRLKTGFTGPFCVLGTYWTIS